MTETTTAKDEDLTIIRKRIASLVKRIAIKRGYDWSNLSREERKPFRIVARDRLKARLNSPNSAL